MTIKETILLEKRFFCLPESLAEKDEKRRAFLNSFLLINYGVILENPERVCDEALRLMDGLLSLHVPKGFYNSPQDTKYFSCEELFLEQVIGYFVGYGTSIKRVEIFEKDIPLPAFISDETKLRKYRILDEQEANAVLRETMVNYLAYKRPFSVEEQERFLFLVKAGFFQKGDVVACRDNIFLILDLFPDLACQLDKKDLVKFSIDAFGDGPYFDAHKRKEPDAQKACALIASSIDKVQDCPLSKRQAKYFNKLVKVFKGVRGKESNDASPYKKAIALIKEGKVIQAADIYAKHGSLLERNLVFLLSRANSVAAVKHILALIDDKNPTLLLQLFFSLGFDGGKGMPRSFSFQKDHRTVVHTETRDETMKRKSIISDSIRRAAHDILLEKIHFYYQRLPKLGKIYLCEDLKRIAIPFGTASMGMGVDVLPAGSRIPIQGSYLRIFCRWEGVRDIDASLGVFPEEEINKPGCFSLGRVLSWRTYHDKPFGNDVLCSGDDTSYDGVEYQDIAIDALKARGLRYAIAAINGYGGSFDEGKIVQGVQIKSKIDTEPWDPKNIEFQMNVVGDSRAFVGFAVDLERKEIVVINHICNGDRLFDRNQVDLCRRYLAESALEVNMHDILSQRGEVVGKPEEADVVFDAEYAPKEGQKVVRPYSISDLVALVNEKLPPKA